jgi:hypothetical protein
MAQTLCIKCGSELKPSSYCQLCQQPLIFACTSCEYITEEKVHTDCRNVQVLAKEEKPQDMTTTTTTVSKPPNDRNKKETLAGIQKEPDKVDEVPSHMTTKNQTNDTFNPFVAGTAIWQSLMSYWFKAYQEFFRSISKVNEEWYNRFWKSWSKL